MSYRSHVRRNSVGGSGGRENRIGQYDTAVCPTERFTGVTVKKVLACFKRDVKALVRHHGSDWVKVLFKLGTSSNHRLTPLGFTHYVSHVSFIPRVNDCEAKAITLSISSCRMHISNSVITRFDNKSLIVKLKKFSLARVPKWMTCIKGMSTPVRIPQDEIET